MSRTPGVLLITSPWLVGIEKNSDVERTVTMRVDELASVAAWKPSRTARRAAKRNTAIATLITVSAVRRLLRRALLKTRPTNFIGTSSRHRDPERVALRDCERVAATLKGSRYGTAKESTGRPPAPPRCPFRGGESGSHVRRRADR